MIMFASVVGERQHKLRDMVEATTGGPILGCSKEWMSGREDALIERSQFYEDLRMIEVETHWFPGQVAANLLRNVSSNKAVAEPATDFVDHRQIGEQRADGGGPAQARDGGSSD